MISNWFYYCFTLLAATFILSSCLDTDSTEIDYTVSRDARIISMSISSSEDSLKVLSKVIFSIDQVSSTPLIFNKDSLPYLFDITKANLQIKTNGASGVKLHLVNPDSSYIWNLTDSVMIKKLKRIEVFAQDGITTKTYTFKLTTHQQDPDTIFWQKQVDAENYIPSPADQVTVSNENHFFTYYKLNNSIELSTSLIDDGEDWTSKTIVGLPQNVILKSIQNDLFEESRIWYALDETNNVYESVNGEDWNIRPTTHTVKTILGKLPSFYEKDSILIVVDDGGTYKFAKTEDFSSMSVLNDIPDGFPVKDFTSIIIKDTLNYSTKYIVTTGGRDINNHSNKTVWLLQENETKNIITSSVPNDPLKFDVTGSTLFSYDNKIYLLVSEGIKNVLYTSTTYGAFWYKASNKQSLPSDFTSRRNQSVCVDDKNNIWIFGGQTIGQTQLVEIWKGRINKLFTK